MGRWLGAALVCAIGCGMATEVSPAGDTASDASSGGSSPSSSASGSASDGATDGTDGGTSGSATTRAEATGDGSASTGAAGLPPPYPIVLAHGFFGFKDFAGVDFVDYFWQVPEFLDEQGESLVFIPTVDPFNDSITRGEQLLARIEEILAETGHAKVNIIGHSQGGVDARYVASLRPDLVDSVTTISTPHFGTPIADLALEAAATPGTKAIVDWLVQTLGAPFWPEVDGGTSLSASMEQLSTEGMEKFNAAYPDQPSVAYYSIAGRSDGSDGGKVCMEVPSPPPFISDWASESDPIDPLFAPTESIVDGGLFSSDPNDGLVRAEDARWGEFLGCIPADHIDQIGHLFGDRPGVFNDWEHQPFYLELVDYLRAKGH